MSHIALPNYVDPQTRASLVLGIEIPFASLAVLVVLLRLYCRAVLRKHWAADDSVMVFATVISVALTIINCLSLLYGTGYHIIDYYASWVKPTGQYGVVTQALFAGTVSLTKISILLFYHRVFPTHHVQFLSKVGILFVLGWGISDLLGSIFECSPSTKIWNPIRHSTDDCSHDVSFLLATASLNTFSDFMILILPLPSLWNLQLDGRQWAAGLFIFVLGIISFVLGLARILFIIIYSKSRDRPYVLAILYIVQAVESDLAIIGGSLPALQLLFHHLLPTIESANASLTGDKRSVINREKPVQKPIQEEEEEPIREKERYLSKYFQLSGPNSPVADEPSQEPIDKSPSNSSFRFNVPPTAPPSFPPPSIPPERNPARVNQRSNSSESPQITPQTSPPSTKITLFPPPDKIPPLKSILKKPNASAPKDHGAENLARSSMWPTWSQAPALQDEIRVVLPPKSANRAPNFGNRETMWPAF